MDQPPVSFRALEGTELPGSVRELPDPPVRLYLHGELPRGPAVAIVGTRRPSVSGAAYARELAGELAARGVTIFSGGAEGIDCAAHQGALDVSGVTVVVAPAGFERPYPEHHRALFRQIVEQGGGYLALVEPDHPAELHSFFARNALLAALTQILVVAEAPLRSGARNAAQQARGLGRPVWVVPSPPWNRRGQGGIVELQLGGYALMSYRDVVRSLARMQLHTVEQPERVARVQHWGTAFPEDSAGAHNLEVALPRPSSGARSARKRRSDPAPFQSALPGITAPKESLSAQLEGEAIQTLTRIREALAMGERTVDGLCHATGLRIQEIQQMVVLLELDGEIHFDAVGRLSWRGAGTSPGETPKY